MFDAKPLETDLEIILQMTNEVIPSVNSRSNLFEFMGSGENVLVNNTDQLRLFYISMTRATSKVYILTEGGKESRFLEFLQ
jgi:superfamily I DNA/RNA helicase